MKITIISPSSQNISAFGARSISSFLKAQGYFVQFITLPVIPEVYRNRQGQLYARKYQYSQRVLNQVIDLVKDSQLVGISLMTQYYHCAIQLTQAIREKVSTLIVWGGVHPTVRPQECLKYADLVCMGEGEQTMAELLERLREGKDYSNVANLCFVKDGAMFRNPVRPLIQNLDELPWLDYGPDHHFILDLSTDRVEPFDQDYFERSLALVPYHQNIPLKSFMYFTTRGCPYRCTYCVNDFYQKLYGVRGFVRKLSVGRMIEELEDLIRRHACIEEIEFCDDNFAVRSERELEHFASLYKERIGLPFQLLISPQNITEEKLLPLVNAGLVFVETGIQSAAEASRDLYQRSCEEERLLKAAAILHKFRGKMAPPCYHLILDNPFESVEETLSTFDLTLKLPRPFWFKRSSLVPFPGTVINQRYAEMGIISNEEEEVYLKILEMPSTTYVNFLFLLNNQNYPPALLRLLSKKGVVALCNRPCLVPLFGMLENGIRLISKIARWTKVLLRGDWKVLRNRILMIGKIPKGVPSSRPPAF